MEWLEVVIYPMSAIAGKTDVRQTYAFMPLKVFAPIEIPLARVAFELLLG